MKAVIVRKCPRCGREVRLERNREVFGVYEGCCECGASVVRKLRCCRKCGMYTLHEIIGVVNGKELWRCERCGNLSKVYIGL